MVAAEDIDQVHCAANSGPEIWGISNVNNKPADFEVIIEEIDKDISNTQLISNPVVMDIVQRIIGSPLKEVECENPIEKVECLEG